MDTNNLPDNSFLSAVDNHNVANGDPSWFEKKIDAIGEHLTDTQEFLTYGVTGAVIAGGVSLLNTAAAAGNFLGLDTEQTKTNDVLKKLDDNLSDYYTKHEQGVEIGGFLLGSVIPGMAGVKALQAAKAGAMGSNMIRSLGLTQSLTRDYAALAKTEFAMTNTPFTILNGNVLKGLAQGYGSQVLEATAFNIAATAAMYKSPTLEEQSISDLFWNDLKMGIVWGGVAGTAVGVKELFGIKKAITNIKTELLPQNFIKELPNKEQLPPILNVLNAFENKFNLPEVITSTEVSPTLGISKEQLLSLKEAARDKTSIQIDNMIRGSLNKFAGDDTSVGNALYEATKDATKIEDIFQSLGPTAQKATRIGTEDTVAASDVYFLNHKNTYDEFQNILNEGSHDILFTGKSGEGAQGYKIVGDLSELKITGVKQAGILSAGSKENAFANGYDIFRSPNGNLSVNPESKIIVKVSDKPLENKILVDLQDNANVKFKGTPGLADLASKTNPIVVNGDIVTAGTLNPIRIGKSVDFNPLENMPHEVQARTIWAQTAKITDGMRIGENDLPLLERIYQEQGNLGNTVLYLVREDKTATRMPTGDTLKNFILSKKQELALKGDGLPVDELSLRLNTTDKFLMEGEEAGWLNITKDSDIQKPRYVKIVYDPTKLESMPMMNANNHLGALEYARQVEAVKERVKQNFANYAKELADYFPDGIKVEDRRWNTASEGAGAGIISSANANYGTYGSWAQSVGIYMEKLLLGKKTATAETLANSFARCTVDSVDEATGKLITGKIKTAEVALSNNRMRASAEGWKLHPDENVNSLVLAKEWEAISKGEMEPTQQIPFSHEDVRNFWETHKQLANYERQPHIANMKGSAGIADNFDPEIIYPIPIDISKLEHFVLVKPRAPVSLDDKTRVIAAKDANTLQQLVSQVDQSKFIVQTRNDNIALHKAIGDYDNALGFNDSVVDSSLKREGILSQHFPSTNESIFDEVTAWHMRQEDLLARSMVYHRYSQEFEELKHLGSQELNMATSQFGFISKGLEQSVKDPYNDIIKTALNISRNSEYKHWVNFNEFVKNSIEQPINKLNNIFSKYPTIDQKFVDEVNSITKEMGQEPPFNTAMSMLIANRNIPDRPWLSQDLAKVQSVLSTTLLQWDTFNAINNIMGNAILMAPEVKNIINAIQKGNPEIAGKLGELMNVKVPGQNFSIPTLKKLVTNSVNNYSRDPEVAKVLMDRYRSINTITDLSQEARDSFNRLQIDWRTVTSSEVDNAAQKAAEFGRKWTGNRRAEEFNRFIASDVMRQICDLGEEAGVLTRAESNEYIQLFVNRTQGNHLYAQRPIVFQGVVGQAISLFQTYQFNFMQQLLRYTAEGNAATAALMLGMQGSIYGLNGMPAFNFLNTHLIGNAEGNKAHTDVFQGAYATLGKEWGDWVLYGTGSNALGLVDPSLKTNLFSRGDINPRQLTVLPTQLADIPVVNASVKFVTNLWNTANKIDNGGDVWASVGQAIEHNGLSRPLAGLAVSLQGYSTTNKGSLLTGGQDFFDIATLTRLAGGKPFNEAVALDNMYRINAYKAKDTKELAEIGSALKTTLVAGKNPSSEQVSNFAAEYMKNGGKIDNFNKFFANAALTANRSQVNALAQNLNSPYAIQFQKVMGGIPLPDYTNHPAIE